ncbi:metallophosphoesterase family protein [Candidatus Micrarchaeota archaeon]|nr:metallophosphoesterase family protein [Candidatus Micrarchaeota archaeon]
MKLLVFSDLHQEDDALDKLREISNREEFDYVLSCGDNSQSVSFLEELVASFPRFFLIPGNWEGESANSFLSRSRNCVNGKRVELEDGLNLVGFGYSSYTPFSTYGELGENEIHDRLGRLNIDNNTILLLHCPPKGYFDLARGQHSGSPSVLKAIWDKKPFVAFFGHIHEEKGTMRLGGTTLVKVPAANKLEACTVNITNKSVTVSFIALR